jgi:hypothetical protein
MIGDSALDVLDCHGRGIDAQHARAFARRRTDATGEFGEIVCLMQTVEGLFPKPAIYEVVPFRDEVMDGATAGHAADELALMTEWDAAIHAAGPLLFQVRLGLVQMKFLPIPNALQRRTVFRQFAVYF